MAPEGCSAARCRRARVVAVVATLTAALKTFGSSARRSGLAGVLLASTASLAAADTADAPVAGDLSRTERKLTGYVMDDSTIRTAVAAWLADASAAETTYGHISTWDTSGVTDMSKLFCAAEWQSWMEGVPWADRCALSTASFNEDIGAWDTSGVTDMNWMFFSASAFDQDIGGWAIDSVTDMIWMFHYATAFDQDLGWCVDDGVKFFEAFLGAQCEATSCGVEHVAGGCAPSPAPTTPAPTVTSAPTASPLVADDVSIRDAVTLWLSNRDEAMRTYGHISAWETGAVTDMSYLFCAFYEPTHRPLCNNAAASFNEDIGAWDTSGVTTMDYMFAWASAFDQDIGAWAVDGVTSMSDMFHDASVFDQDISGWAVHNVRDMHGMFSYSDIPGISAFNQDLGGWAVDSVTAMSSMFWEASAFNQDLGWCVGDVFDPWGAGTSIGDAFAGTPCASASCGVDVQGTSCPHPTPRPTPAPTTPAPTTPAPTTPAPTPAPTPTPIVDAARRLSAGAALLALAL
jgi:hypothetical protein